MILTGILELFSTLLAAILGIFTGGAVPVAVKLPVCGVVLGVALLSLSQGCAGQHVKRIGQVSKRPLIHVQVGTTFDVYIPSIEFETEKGDAPTGTIP